MPFSSKDLKQIARLAYLDIDPEDSSKLTDEVNSIMDFVEQLSSVDTSQVSPLFHPLALHQRLRPDTITEESCIAELEAIAPQFEDNLYLVPKFIESGK